MINGRSIIDILRPNNSLLDNLNTLGVEGNIKIPSCSVTFYTIVD